MDDTIFSSDRTKDLQSLKFILLVFGHILGLKINLNKSKLLGININHEQIIG